MALKLFNTMTRSKDEFHPLEPGHVRMYTCGPTVHDFAHIGNFRAYTFEDLLRRFLKFKGYKVTQVMNLTDIDDKTIKKSIAQNVSLRDYTAVYKKAFFEDLDRLGIERAEFYPEATTHIPEMVDIVKKLLARGYAYEVGGNYYYSIAKFRNYGNLSHLDMSGLKAGARVAADEYEKESVSDFALWKAWDENDGDVFWETELGKGRPGWHLECSAMSMKYLGETFDIHTGGVDNMFPHHENEIAQSEGASGKKFVNLWLHCEHLIVEGRKMAKSFKNFYTLRDILEKGYPSIAVRYLLLATHYRQQLNFTFEGLDAARNGLVRYNDFYSNLLDYGGEGASGEAGEYIDKMLLGFETALDDDLNISQALGEVFDFIRDINRLKAENKLSGDERNRALSAMDRIESVLNFRVKKEETSETGIEALIQKRAEAKKNRNFAEADRIRLELFKMGIILEDTPSGTKWKRKL
ncbi:Cysteine--tRNA ligase [Candidatus Zixiibacteriota bacterium]|nr:Cysteine--tRNA ligase [candidate division Zixibacteria bacterium]